MKAPDWPMDRWQLWAGPSKHFLVFPVRHGEMVNYVGFVPTDEKMKESWSAPGDPEVLRREFFAPTSALRNTPIRLGIGRESVTRWT